MESFAEKLRAVLKFDRLEKGVKTHLQKVYGCLALSMLCAAVGAYVHLFTHLMQAGLLTLVGSVGLLIWLYSTPHTPENESKRLGMLVGFSFLTGVGLGPLLQVAIQINPSIVPTALLATMFVFICFSASALLGNQRHWLYLGGSLMVGLLCLVFTQIVSIVFQSRLMFEVYLYLGLALMCLFVIYDTQLIVEKRRRGDNDYIWHSVDLFIDMVDLFRFILSLLSNKEDKRKN